MEESKFGTAVVKEACPICGKLMDAGVVMNKRVSVKAAKEVEEMHGKCVGYAESPCEECEANKKLGIILVGVDLSKTEDKSNPHRTGKIVVIKKEAAEKAFTNVDLSNGALMVPLDTWEALGLNDLEG